MSRKLAKMTTQLQIQTLSHSNIATIRGTCDKERKSEWKRKLKQLWLNTFILQILQIHITIRK